MKPSVPGILEEFAELAEQIEEAITGGSYMNRLNAWPRDEAMRQIVSEIRRRISQNREALSKE